jgi:uncharacterized membrane protein HdeD (DUF308 family)
MTVPASFLVRAFYITVGIAVVVASFVMSARRGLGAIFLPLIFGILLIVQGISGA